VALLVARALETAGAAYFLGESLASSIDGEPRATNDIDFVIDMPLGRVESFRRDLGVDFELDEDMLREALLHGSCANGFYLPLVLKVDFFGHAHGPFDDSEFARRRPVQLRQGAGSLLVKAPEDTVLRKLLWYRQGGEVSDRQWRDVLGVLRNNPSTLDVEYMTAWAGRLGTMDLLDRARRELSDASRR
jgi:hypothetical protein